MKLIRPLNARFHCLSSGADDARVAGGGDRLEWSVRPQGWGPATAGRRRDGVQMMFPDGGSRDEEVGGKEGRAKHGQDDGEEASKGNFEARMPEGGKEESGQDNADGARTMKRNTQRRVRSKWDRKKAAGDADRDEQLVGRGHSLGSAV